MKKISLTLGLFLLIFFTACGPSREKSVLQIKEVEKKLYDRNITRFSKSGADSLVKMYDDFAKRFPEDSLSPAYLFNGAGISMNSNEGAKALELFNLIIEKYPSYRKAPLCLFFKGYVEENLLHNLDKAKELYLQFIEKYPSNEFVSSAKASLQNLGKTPEQMMREFEARQKADSTRVADSVAKLKGKRKKMKK
ncbi:MAG: tetratricopeptide repeat protein [Bacteroidetes bacterium]|nr:tetratricopeptide repeat protein [Bacteroidota bacterium]